MDVASTLRREEDATMADEGDELLTSWGLTLATPVAEIAGWNKLQEAIAAEQAE